MPRNEDLTPKQRAKKFSTGTHTASQTGARGQASEENVTRTKRQMYKQATESTQSDFDRMISRGGR